MFIQIARYRTKTCRTPCIVQEFMLKCGKKAKNFDTGKLIIKINLLLLSHIIFHLINNKKALYWDGCTNVIEFIIFVLTYIIKRKLNLIIT